MEKLKRVVAIILLISAMSTTLIGLLPGQTYAAEKVGACDAAGCDVGSTKCAEIVTEILWGLIKTKITCYDDPKPE